jgi:hypothetical protein
MYGKKAAGKKATPKKKVKSPAPRTGVRRMSEGYATALKQDRAASKRKK